MNKKEKDSIQLLNILLQLKEHAVGVKFFKTEDEYRKDNSRELIKAIPYCVAVKCAMKGHAIKLNSITSGCNGSSRAIGIDAPDDMYYSGMRGYRMGLYKNQDVACKVAHSFCILKEPCYGVSVKPLEEWEEDPDCVLVIADSYTIMRIIQGYANHFGASPRFEMTGNQGICIECTTYPYYHKTLNVSMLCSGTRHNAKWSDTAIGAGMAFSVFSDIVDGIYRTVNATEDNKRKRIIMKELERYGYDISGINMGDAYYLR